VTQQIKGEDMINNIIGVWNNMATQSIALLNTSSGVWATMFVFLMSFFAPIGFMLYIILGLTVIDLALGFTVSFKGKRDGKPKEGFLSNKAKNSLLKLFFYVLFISLFYIIETAVIDGDGTCFSSKLIFAIMAAVEMWSIAANALIIYPKFPFLKLFKKFLSSEISKKLEMDKKSVEEILEDKVDVIRENTKDIKEEQSKVRADLKDLKNENNI
jgi:hypothetical protein